MKGYKILIVCIIIILNSFFLNGVAQVNKNELALSIPYVHNMYKITNIIGPQREIEGQSWSYSINANYSRNLNKYFFVIVGIGVNKQNFNLQRPFNYISPIFLLYTTQSYYYFNWQWLAGLGYDYKITKHVGIISKIMYNQLYCFKQYYQSQTGEVQVNNRKFTFGNTFITTVSNYYNINYRYSFCIEVSIPTLTKWHKDPIFNENPNDYFKPENAFGLGVSCIYHF